MSTDKHTIVFVTGTLPDYLDIWADDKAVGWLSRRPDYCDRGHWEVVISLPGIDGADRFPRYYMSLKAAKQETAAFLRWRLWMEKTYNESLTDAP